MPEIELKPDTLDSENRRFHQKPLLTPVFLNSVPKSGTHLLRNILRMFVPVEQQYKAQFIQWPNLHEHSAAFDPQKNMLSWGHLLFSDASAFETSKAKRVLLVRDPYDWVLSRARFFVSDQFRGNLDRLKSGELSVEDLLNLMIFGIYQKTPSLADQYLFNAVSWVGTSAFIVRYEDLLAHVSQLDTTEADDYFSKLFDHVGIEKPDDWRDRVAIGSDTKQSGTATENLTLADIPIPKELPAVQKQLVDLAAPGYRAILGYI